MATIGQVLTAPESGWRRYDDKFSDIIYTGTWINDTSTDYYNGDAKYCNTIDASVKFKFSGTQLRIIGIGQSGASSNIEIDIDGVKQIFSQNNATIVRPILNFESDILAKTLHTVIITNKQANIFCFDAIDIDSTGYLLPYNWTGNIQSNPASMSIGDFLPCRYTAPTSGQVGTFSELGTTTATPIPTTSSATPDGSFNFIMVDKDYKGRKILVGDRNIQHSVSWNSLNTKGIASGSGLPYWITDNKFKYSIRLLTGGISSTDTDNEWHKYIVNSDLNSTITAGDNAIWNWSGLTSWMNTTPDISLGTNMNLNRVRQGNSAVNGFTQSGTSSYSGTTTGFRPVLIVETIKPSPPTGLTVTDVSYNSATLTWTPSENTKSYNIYDIDGNFVANTALTSFNLTNLSGNTPYSYSVTAVNDGGESLATTTSFLTLQIPPPSIPVNLQITSNTLDSVIITWDSSENATSYNIYNSDNSLYINNVLETTYTFTNLDPNTNYQFTITGVNGSKESEKSLPISFLTYPTNPEVNVTDITNNSAVLSWINEEGLIYKLYNDQDETINSNVTSPYSINELTSGTNYTYKISATNSTGESDKTIISFITIPSEISNLISSNITDNSVTISWSAVTGASGYNIYDESDNIITNIIGTSYDLTNLIQGSSYTYKVSALNESGESLKSQVTFTTKLLPITNLVTINISGDKATLTWDLNLMATGYSIYNENNELIGQTEFNTFEIIELTNGTNYTFKVTAYNSIIESDFVSLNVLTLPSMPVITILDIKSTSVIIGFNEVISATSYKIFDSSQVLIDTTTLLNYEILSLTPETSYIYYICAINSSGDSSLVEVQFTTAMDKVSGIIISEITSTSALITWESLSIADSYNIYDKNNTLIENTTNTFYRIRNLTSDTDYVFKLCASKDDINGEMTTIEFTTLISNFGRITDFEANITSNSQRKVIRDSDNNIWICFDAMYESNRRIFIRKIVSGRLNIWDGSAFVLNGTATELPIETLSGYDQVNPTIVIDSVKTNTLIVDDVAMITYIASAMVSSGATGTVDGDSITGYNGTLWDSAKAIFYSMEQTMVDSLRNAMIAETCGYLALNQVNGLWEFLHNKYLTTDTPVPVTPSNIVPSEFFVQGFNIQAQPDWSKPTVIQAGAKISYPATILLRDATQTLVTLNATFYIYDPTSSYNWKSGGFSDVTFKEDLVSVLGSNNSVKMSVVNYIATNFAPYKVYGTYNSTTHIGYITLDSSSYTGNYPSTTKTATLPLGTVNDGDETRFINPPSKPISLNNADINTIFKNKVGVLSTVIPTTEVMEESNNASTNKGEIVHVIWTGKDGINTVSDQIKHCKFEGSSWTSWANISEINGFDQKYPSIGIDSYDNVHVVWFGKDVNNEFEQIKYSKYDFFTSTWSGYHNIQEISGYPQLYPSIAIDPVDNLSVVWHGTDSVYSNFQIKMSNFNGSNWSIWTNIQPIENYDQMYPSIAIESISNKRHVAWQGADTSQNFTKIKYSMYNGELWSDWKHIENITGYNQMLPTIAYCFGDIFVFWHGYDVNNENVNKIKYAKLNGSTWSAWANLDTGMNPNIKWSQFNNPDTIELIFNNEDNYIIYRDITIPPPAPSNLIGIPQSVSKILWTWTDNSLNETGFRMMDENGTILATLDKNVTQWLETGLTPNLTVTRTLESYSIYGGGSVTIQGTSTTRSLPSFIYFDGIMQGVNNIRWTIRT